MTGRDGSAVASKERAANGLGARFVRKNEYRCSDARLFAESLAIRL